MVKHNSLNWTQCSTVSSNIHFISTKLKTPGSYRSYGRIKELLLEKKLPLRSCSKYRLASYLEDYYDILCKDGCYINNSSIKNMQKQIIDGSYKLAPITVNLKYITEDHLALPWYSRAYLIGDSQYLSVSCKAKDLLVIKALGRMLHFSFKRNYPDSRNSYLNSLFEDNPAYVDNLDKVIEAHYYSYYTNLCSPEIKGEMDLDLVQLENVPPNNRAIRIFFLDIRDSLQCINQNQLISLMKYYVGDDDIIKLLNDFLCLPIKLGKGVKAVNMKPMVIPPVGCLLTEYLFECVINDLDSVLDYTFPYLRIHRSKNEILFLLPLNCSPSEYDSLQLEECINYFNSTIPEILDLYNLKGRIFILEPGGSPLHLPLMPEGHKLNDKPEFTLSLNKEGYLEGESNLNPSFNNLFEKAYRIISTKKCEQ